MPRDANAPLPVSAPALALWLVEQAAERGVLLHIFSGEDQLARVRAAAEAFAGTGIEVLVLPPWDVLPYDRSAPSASVVGQRVRTLEALPRPAERARLVLTTADAALQRVPARESWADSAMWLEVGRELDIDALRASLAERGYHLDERIDEPGEVAIRGQVIDVFPAGDPCPVRLTLNDDGRIASIQSYDAATQRSTGALDRIALHRAVEFPPDPDELEQAAEALANPGQADDADEPELPALPSRLVPLFDTCPASPPCSTPRSRTIGARSPSRPRTPTPPRGQPGAPGARPASCRGRAGSMSRPLRPTAPLPGG